MEKQEKNKILMWAKKHGMSIESKHSLTPHCDCDLHQFGDFLETLVSKDECVCDICSHMLRRTKNGICLDCGKSYKQTDKELVSEDEECSLFESELLDKALDRILSLEDMLRKKETGEIKFIGTPSNPKPFMNYGEYGKPETDKEITKRMIEEYIKQYGLEPMKLIPKVSLFKWLDKDEKGGIISKNRLPENWRTFDCGVPYEEK